MSTATVTAAVAAAIVWARFKNGRVLPVVTETGVFDTVVTVTEASDDYEALLDQLAEAVTASTGGIENFVFTRLHNDQYRVTGQITDWHLGEEFERASEWELVDPLREDIEVLATSLNVSIVEAEHVLAAIGNEYGAESVIKTFDGREIRCPAYPLECDYVRITVPGATPLEVAYWNCDEWAEMPMEVMGAILGAARGSTKN